MTAACGTGADCGLCKPALAYLVSEVNDNRHREERAARFINDRVHANIQNDGTFSVVPRMYGGVTTPDELRRIADAAEKYEAPHGQGHRRPADRPAGREEVRPARRCGATSACPRVTPTPRPSAR